MNIYKISIDVNYTFWLQVSDSNKNLIENISSENEILDFGNVDPNEIFGLTKSFDDCMFDEIFGFTELISNSKLFKLLNESGEIKKVKTIDSSIFYIYKNNIILDVFNTEKSIVKRFPFPPHDIYEIEKYHFNINDTMYDSFFSVPVMGGTQLFYCENNKDNQLTFKNIYDNEGYEGLIFKKVFSL
ncbi:hypothetical protein [Flammeovirga kamogawensis]|uniref:Uncharacterized protein n=1 Tax=Flammeovirga kamogawensis TaxID=373891 RepID=A0ABX8GTJ0_9BACT|nr:hypothetical protein [Flammeovirga kamogawensis]MBB6460040.1 hypothetical protein [Flammeovirga kamogawensis]QWG06913.1 hypothetical protein KM029_16630 [Flammeovirga kamogawensis]TRX68735.1 hypothetical protein EO216_11625 [Flammeovirga kamogawensis]